MTYFEKYKGLSFAINIGSNGGIYWQHSSRLTRLCLWRIAFTIYYFDVDMIGRMLIDCTEENNKLKSMEINNND